MYQISYRIKLWVQENDLKKFLKFFCYAVTIFLVNIMLRILVYFTNRKKLIYIIFFVAITLSVIQYLFSLQNNNGKLDFCLDDVVFSLQHLKDIKCSILESQDQEKCQENWIKSDEFISDNQVQNRLSNCSNYFTQVNTTAMLPMLETETSLGFSIVLHNQIGLFESLMASIVRSQNVYCIFVDAKANSKLKSMVKALISCYSLQYPKVIFLIWN